jgi:hypothetical protein
LAAPILLGAYGFESLRGLGFVATERLWYGSASRLYLTNLETSLERVAGRSKGRPTLVDDLVPRYLNTIDFAFTHQSHLFRALSLEGRFVDVRRARFLVAPDGHIVENPFRHRKRPRSRARAAAKLAHGR